LNCPECGSLRLWKDGLHYLKDGTVQRWLCRNCGYRFSKDKADETSALSPPRNDFKNFGKSAISSKNKSGKNKGKAKQANVIVEKQTLKMRMKNEKRAAGATATETDVKGKIFEYAWWMKKQGYSPSTIESRIRKLKRLANLGANLLDPESVKDVIAKQAWKTSTKANVSNIYGCFIKLNGLDWNPPIYKPNYEMPFIPTEAEIDQLIAAAGKKLAALLQLIKETGIRIGEACRLRWIDLDSAQHTLRVQAEKNSKPRIFHVSESLLGMLNALPRKSERIFPNNPRSLETWFRTYRNRLAHKLGNPRLKQITFHTLRHWKATMEYHKTKDILHVKEFLGHRSLDSTLTYINIERAIFGAGEHSEFHVKTAQTPEEVKALLEVGFEYICEKDGLLFFRKRK